MNNLSTDEATFNLRSFFAIIQRHIWFVGATVVIIVTLVSIWTFKVVPVYRATSQILIDPIDPNVLTFKALIEQKVLLDEYYATQYKLLESRNLLGRTVKGLKLFERKGFGIPREIVEDPVKAIFSSITSSTIGFIRGLVEDRVVGKGKLSRKFLVPPRERAINSLSARLFIEPVRRTRLVLVHYEDIDPAVATEMVNGVVKHYLELNLELRNSTTKEASEWIGKQISSVRNGLLASERALQEYKEKYNIVSLEESYEDRKNIMTQRLGAISNASTREKTKTIALKVLVDRVKEANGNIEALSSLPDVVENLMLQDLNKDYIRTLSEYSEISKRYKKRHPRRLRLKSMMVQMKKKIDEEIGNVAKNIITRYRVAKAREKSLMESLEKQKQETLRLNRLGIEYMALKRENEINRTLYEEMLKRQGETNLMVGLKSSNVRVLDWAEIPRFPVRPQKGRNISIAFASSLIIGIILAFTLDHLDTHFHSSQEVENTIGLKVIGWIPNVGRKKNKWDGTKNKDLYGKESFRALRTVMLLRLGNDRKVVLITSSLPAEGKTFISANLGMILRETDKKILLIDGDIHRRAFHDWFDVPRSPGLLQAILKQVPIGDAIYRIDDSNLNVMPSGAGRDIPHGIYDSSMLQSFVSEVKNDYDFVLIDSPPLLVVSDPLMWASCVDGIIIIIDLERATEGMIKQSIQKLDEIDVPIIGAVLNMLKKQNDYYYYGYYKKYGYYYGDGGNEKKGNTV